ncbi:hypothetical protein [Kibdelosporangium phytohabitans]|uniref:Secreted protein n=1 Tax=Kibdelosporangium phytohabitans TaxID=860235 RepID=A0A0N7F504_9PSEU|nr:hypothetical protein [Kibdelosporangium phytohabitans]ALG12879.1 hypothetical protein AOZ06_43890 [Kibdelosporangium phytohabitans]MBE1464583.1 hypothetical protein [Kibdelosporangium phytohabitans]
MREIHWATRTGLIVLVLLVFGVVGYVVTRPSPAAHHIPPPVVPHSDGLSDNQDGFRFNPVVVPRERGAAMPIAFQIIGPSGKPETSFPENQTKQLHFFVVRDDMQAYQHVHPELRGDTWHTTASVPDGGAYRMYAEFIGRDPLHPIVLGTGFIIPGDTTFVPLPEPAARAAVDGFVVTRPEGAAQPPVGKPSTVRLRITDASGAPVTAPEEHLGAYGHLTGFNAILHSVTHLHPLQRVGTALPDGELAFQANFAERGEHRLFLEFRVGGTVRTAAFTVFVT